MGKKDKHSHGFQRKTIRVGDIFCDKWSEGNKIALIIKGQMVATSDSNFDGTAQEHIICTYGQNDLIGLEIIFSDTYIMRIKAATDVEIAEIDVNSLFEKLSADNEFMRSFILRVISMYIRLLNKCANQYEELSFFQKIIEKIKCRNIVLTEGRDSTNMTNNLLRRIILRQSTGTKNRTS